jgi:hypothetical protein
MAEQDYITLKWGTLKSWNITSTEGKALLKRYIELCNSISAMLQHDTPEQKEIICKLIDLMPGKIYLDWDDKYVSKEVAKKYVLEYDVKADDHQDVHLTLMTPNSKKTFRK